MTQISAGRVIKDVDLATGKKYEFVTPDMRKLMGTPVRRNDEILIPVNIRGDAATFWEVGGRNSNAMPSIGTIIAGESDQLLDAIIFNKLNKTPSSKQALIGLVPGYRLYAGKVSTRDNVLAPKIKIIRMIYDGINDKGGNSKYSYGKFIVDQLFTDYNSLSGCFPAQRLVNKMFSKNVVRPFYANGWSITNITGIRNKEKLHDNYIRLIDSGTDERSWAHADQFLDAVEDSIVAMNNERLSAVLQCIDFEKGVVTMKPLIGMDLPNITGTIGSTTSDETFTTPIVDMLECYNSNIMFETTDIKLLELAMMHDDQYAVSIGHRKYCICRGWRG